jgi:UDP-glucose 6-dehydrogenase
MTDIIKNIGFIGTGFVGGSLIRNMEARGFKNLVTYSLEHQETKEQIKDCFITFIAVPTPTIKGHLDTTILEEVLGLIGDGNVAVIRSTVDVEALYRLQAIFDNISIIHNPEFLDEVTAQSDTDNPQKQILGVWNTEDEGEVAIANIVMDMLPEAPYKAIMTYKESAMIKYIHNAFFVFKNVFFNMSYDLVKRNEGDWDEVIKAVVSDKRITPTHTNIFHKSGRGAGGHCLIKDFPVFKDMVGKTNQWDMTDRTELAYDICALVEKHNLDTLKTADKDQDIVSECY